MTERQPIARGNSVDGIESWFGVGVTVYVVIFAAMVLYFAAENNVGELEGEIRDLRREISALQREVEYRGEADDRDVERILWELRRER